MEYADVENLLNELREYMLEFQEVCHVCLNVQGHENPGDAIAAIRTMRHVLSNNIQMFLEGQEAIGMIKTRFYVGD